MDVGSPLFSGTPYRSLDLVQRQKTELQQQLSSGLAVVNAASRPSRWALAQQVTTDIKTTDATLRSLELARSTLSVGEAASATLVDLVNQQRTLLLQAQENPSLAPTLQAQFDALTDKAESIIRQANVNGFNPLTNRVTYSTEVDFDTPDGSGSVLGGLQEDLGTNLGVTNSSLSSDPDQEWQFFDSGEAFNNTTLTYRPNVDPTEDVTEFSLSFDANIDPDGPVGPGFLSIVFADALVPADGLQVILGNNTRRINVNWQGVTIFTSGILDLSVIEERRFGVEVDQEGVGRITFGDDEFLFAIPGSEWADEDMSDWTARVNATNGFASGVGYLDNLSAEVVSLKPKPVGVLSGYPGLDLLSPEGPVEVLRGLDVTDVAALNTLDGAQADYIEAGAIIGRFINRLEGRSEFYTALNSQYRGGLSVTQDVDVAQAQAELQYLQVREALVIEAIQAGQAYAQRLVGLFL